MGKEIKNWVFTGVECTFKTTLSERFAAATGMPLVPEFARVYLQRPEAASLSPEAFPWSEFQSITRGQFRALQSAHFFNELSDTPSTVFDTDMLTLKIWCEDKFPNETPPAWSPSERTMYLLCAPTNVQAAAEDHDPWRIDSHRRELLHERYLAALRNQGANVIELQEPTFEDRWAELTQKTADLLDAFKPRD